MPNTIGDFWRMIWEKKLTAVVMLTKINEAGKVKGHHCPVLLDDFGMVCVEKM